jgi:hypothetical protein
MIPFHSGWQHIVKPFFIEFFEIVLMIECSGWNSMSADIRFRRGLSLTFHDIDSLLIDYRILPFDDRPSLIDESIVSRKEWNDLSG